MLHFVNIFLVVFLNLISSLYLHGRILTFHAAEFRNELIFVSSVFFTTMYFAVSLEIWFNRIIIPHKTCFHILSISFYLEFEMPPLLELLVELNEDLFLNLIMFALVEGFQQFIRIYILQLYLTLMLITIRAVFAQTRLGFNNFDLRRRRIFMMCTRLLLFFCFFFLFKLYRVFVLVFSALEETFSYNAIIILGIIQLPRHLSSIFDLDVGISLICVLGLVICVGRFACEGVSLTILLESVLDQGALHLQFLVHHFEHRLQILADQEFFPLLLFGFRSCFRLGTFLGLHVFFHLSQFGFLFRFEIVEERLILKLGIELVIGAGMRATVAA